MPDFSLKTETFGQDNQSWLGSAHGTDAARTGTLNIATLTSTTHYPDGHLPSGVAVGKITATGLYGLCDKDAADGRQTLVGHTLTAQKIGDGNVVVPILDHGRIVEANLPFAITAEAKTSAAGRLIYV
ncbi:K structural protein [Rhodococcus marinonascens]|uniref:K structural protein n=1 Tax=Rhodococcus marinonascens TaxID=38311 RepID=UPI0009327570|nr:K structural protein [Rhodococcus marinonascens]